MTIYCSCCGRKHSFSYSAQNVLRAAYTLGWGSFGSALYCPECTRTWDDRNPGRPMPGPDNTIRVIDGLYQPERGPYHRKTKEGVIMKPGDKVVMNNNYYVAEANKGKIWTVVSEPWNCGGTMVVKLDGKSGGYAVDGLNLVEE